MKPEIPAVPFQYQGFQGQVIPALESALPEILASLLKENPNSGQLVEVKRNLYRAVYRVPNFPGNLGTVYFKRYLFPSFGHRLKYFFRTTRAEVEWKVACTLHKLEVPSLEPLGFAVLKNPTFPADAFFLSKEIENAIPLDRFLERIETHERQRFLEALAKFIAKIHENSVHHHDLHQSNLLARNPTAPEIFLVDLHTVTIGGELTLREKVANLAQLIHSIQKMLIPEEIRYFLEVYKQASKENFPAPEAFWEIIQKKIHAIDARHSRSRDRRCLVRSSAFDVKKGLTSCIYRRRDFEVPKIEKVLEKHHNGPEILKQDGRSLVTKLETDTAQSMTLCVKETKPGGLGATLEECFLGTRGKRAWFASHALSRRNIAHPKAFALKEKRLLGLPRRSFLITEYLKDTSNLYDYFENRYSSLMRKDRIALFSALARFIGELHRLGLYHRDLQLRNILIQKNAPQDFFLVDLENLNPKTELTHPRQTRNLMQLNDSPKSVTRMDKIRFLRAYEQALGKKLEKAQIKEVIRETQARLARASRLS